MANASPIAPLFKVIFLPNDFSITFPITVGNLLSFITPIAVMIADSSGAVFHIPIYVLIALSTARTIVFPTDFNMLIQFTPTKNLPIFLPSFVQLTFLIALEKKLKISVTSLDVSLPNLSQSPLAISSNIVEIGFNALEIAFANSSERFCIFS